MEQTLIIRTDEHSLSGVLHLPGARCSSQAPAIIICHGFISSKVGQHRFFVKAARHLCQAGFPVLRFDYSGCGDSTGEYHNVTIHQHLEEIGKAIDFISEHPRIKGRQLVLLGHSLGGALAAVTAARDARIDKLILLSATAQPLHDIINIVGLEAYQHCLAQGTVNFEGFELGKPLFSSLQIFHPLASAGNFNGDVLIVHGSADTETPISNTALYERAYRLRDNSTCEVEVVAGADHTYASTAWEQDCFSILELWLSRTQQGRSREISC